MEGPAAQDSSACVAGCCRPPLSTAALPPCPRNAALGWLPRTAPSHGALSLQLSACLSALAAFVYGFCNLRCGAQGSNHHACCRSRCAADMRPAAALYLICALCF